MKPRRVRYPRLPQRGRQCHNLRETHHALRRELAERKEAEEALLQSTRRLTGIVLHAQEIIYTVSPDGLITFISPSVRQLLGYTEEALLGRHFSVLVHPEDLEICNRFLANILQGRDDNSRVHCRVRHAAGYWRWFASTGSLQPGNEAGPPSFVGIAQDITEQKQAQDRLEESERMYRLLAEHSADVIFTTNARYHFTYLSPAIERLTGFAPNELVHKPLPVLLHQRSLSTVQAALQERLETERLGQGDDSSRVWELELRCKNGQALWTETVTTPLRDSEGRFEGVLGVTRDIMARKAAEQALEQAHRDMGALISAITAILILVDPHNRITHWNNSACEVLGLPADLALGSRLEVLALDWPRELVLEGLERCRSTGEPQRLDDLRFGRAHAGEGLLGLTCYPVQGGGVLLLARDITAARTQELRQAHEQRMQSIGRLAAGMAHEINTPMQYLGFNAGFLENGFRDLVTILRGYREFGHELLQQGICDCTLPPELTRRLHELERLDRELDLEYLLDELPQAIAGSRQGIEQITDIVQAMKQLTHPGRMAERSMGLVDINNAVLNAVTVTRNEWKQYAELETDLDPTRPLVPGWGGELGQVLVNLLLNAAQAMEEKAASGDGTKGRIQVSTRALEREVEIRVADNGPGVPEAIRDKIFDLFFTTKDVGKGSGQGLALAHAIVVEQHGGSLELDSPESGGAVFRIRLPGAACGA